MQQILSVENMRNSDAKTIESGVPSKELMLRAAKGIFDSVNWDAPVAVVCGKGNNAGDGFALAELLYEANISCKVFLLSDKFSEDGLYYYNRCVNRGIETEKFEPKTSLCGYKTIVDCIFGTGFKGKPEGIYAEAIEAINNSGAFVVSADINSGLNGDTGLCELAVKSNVTVSVGGLKSGQFLNMAKDYIQQLVNIDIGINAADRTYNLVDEEYVKTAFPARKNFSNKGDYGYVALMGGCEKYTGAIRLAAMATCAARAGAGVVQAAVPKSLANLVGSQILESTVYPLSEENGYIKFNKEELQGLCRRCRAIAFGMGIGLGEEQGKCLQFILGNFNGNLIIDADGLSVLAKLLALNPQALKTSECRVILTPHLKEFSRLLNCRVDDILASPIVMAEKFAKDYGCVVLLKGPSTIITDGLNTNITDRGCPGMATAGSGDVLSGIMAGVCGYNEDILLAASAAAYINGLAGEAAQAETGAVSQLAGDTAMQVMNVIKNITRA